jgi:hypothetical protein
LPLLQRARLPATLFVATVARCDPTPWWWQEVLLRALRKVGARWGSLWSALGAASNRDPPPGERELHLLRRYADATPAMREQQLVPFVDAALLAEGRHMLRPTDLATLPGNRLALGVH